MSDPFVAAWLKVRAFIDEGNHTEAEVTEYAQELNQQLPPVNDVATAMIAMQAITAIVTDLNGEPP